MTEVESIMFWVALFGFHLMTLAYVGATMIGDLRKRRFGWAAIGLAAAVFPTAVVAIIAIFFGGDIYG